MSAIEESIQVHAPLGAVYDHWTQFEEFPTFMEGIEEVRQIDATHLHWVAAFGGQRHEWDAEVTEQRPDERVAWKNTDGKDNAGVVTFHRLDDTQTQVMVQMDFVPEGIVEKLGNVLGVPSHRVRGDLERFKDRVEAAGRTAEGRRGEVKRPDEASEQPSVKMDDSTSREGEPEPQSTRAPEARPDEPSTESDSGSARDVSTPFSPHDQDDSPLGDTDQHSAA